MDYAAKAADWAAKADKKLKSFSLFGGNKYEEAAEMYEKAANQYKLAKSCERQWEGGDWRAVVFAGLFVNLHTLFCL